LVEPAAGEQPRPQALDLRWRDRLNGVLAPARRLADCLDRVVCDQLHSTARASIPGAATAGLERGAGTQFDAAVAPVFLGGP
jgi:hypothetical protein